MGKHFIENPKAQVGKSILTGKADLKAMSSAVVNLVVNFR